MERTQVRELKAELDYFEQHRAEFLETAAGKFALIKGESLLGMFDSEASAIRCGYETLGNVPFLVKQVTEVDMPISLMSHNGPALHRRGPFARQNTRRQLSR